MIRAFLRQRGTAVGVSKGPIPAVTPNGAAGLPRVTAFGCVAFNRAILTPRV
jgi:hypothetical protein